jgi:hypothetical protein
MRPVKLQALTSTVGNNPLFKFTLGDVGSGWDTLSVRLSNAGRLISVGLGTRTLHSREQRAVGGVRYRLPKDKLNAIKDMVAAIEAAKALGADPWKIPLREIDL